MQVKGQLSHRWKMLRTLHIVGASLGELHKEVVAVNGKEDGSDSTEPTVHYRCGHALCSTAVAASSLPVCAAH